MLVKNESRVTFCIEWLVLYVGHEPVAKIKTTKFLKPLCTTSKPRFNPALLQTI